jgi:hypothetical protein
MVKDLGMWKYTDETQYVLKEVDKEIETAKNEILDFGGIMASPYLEREYCRALGYLDGLRYLKKTIEESKDETT